LIFASLDEAGGYMEAIDVDDGEYEAAYLHDGTILDVVIPLGPDGPVLLRCTGERDLAGLRDRIAAYQRARGRPQEVSDLIVFANDLLREEWEQARLQRPRWLARWLTAREGPRQVDAT
jgi:hypothetical protein